MKKYNIAIIGAGNGGQAMAGHFSLLGHRVRLYSRSLQKIQAITQNEKITLTDIIKGAARIDMISNDMKLVLEGAKLIMVVTTADAHRAIAAAMANHLENNQIIVLNPGRTLGAIEFSDELKKKTSKRLFIGETQSLIYACRAISPGNVRIIGVKEKVLFSAYPSNDTEMVIGLLNEICPCFEKAENVLHTSLENIGSVLHPPIVLFNAEIIKRGVSFYFYRDMTTLTASFIARLDKERINVGKAFGINLLSVDQWVTFAYPDIKGETFLEKIHNNPAYKEIISPKNINTRFVFEDIPTGLVPISRLGKLVNIDTQLINAIINIFSSLLGVDFWSKGRCPESLGLSRKTKNDIINEL